MTKLMMVEKLRAAIQEWARQHNVELALVEVNPTGLDLNVQIIVVARKGFENWPEIERFQNLYKYLRSKLNDAGVANMMTLITMTEEEYDQYDRVEVA